MGIGIVSRIARARASVAAALCASLVASAGCSTSVTPAPAATTAYASSPTGAGIGTAAEWTTHAPAGGAPPATSWQAPPRPIALSSIPLAVPAAENGAPPPPPPPVANGVSPPAWSTPAPYYTGPSGPVYATPAPCPPGQAPTLYRTVVPQRAYSGCGLPCESGLSQWHIRGVGGPIFYEGDDPAEDCGYWGVDLGRTHCGCWGWDVYYRHGSGVFQRDDPPMAEDGGQWHHLGAKVTMERGFGTGSRFYWWAGLGLGYFWTEEYVENDDGLEYFGEAGIGFVLSRNWMLRAGVNVHGTDTSVTRADPANDGESRFLWHIAPVLELEFSF
jgi:hypothetical protein